MFVQFDICYEMPVAAIVIETLELILKGIAYFQLYAHHFLNLSGL